MKESKTDTRLQEKKLKITRLLTINYINMKIK